MITKWKKQLLNELPRIFSNGNSVGKKEKEYERLIASLYQKIGQLEVELDWLKKNLEYSVSDKRGLIDGKECKISIVRQCELLGISRSGYYYKPAQESPYNLLLMRLIDEQYTKCPFYGIPRMTVWLRKEGHKINHKRVERLMGKRGFMLYIPNHTLVKVQKGTPNIHICSMVLTSAVPIRSGVLISLMFVF